ncbi:MAG: RIP metalloprotease RseP [Ignavibacteriales bacterium]|nr:RIP metalloprotease RseP [Ignavibacteriales bacterium]
MEVLSTIFYFIVTIGVLVLVHEVGHFATAKFFGMRVDRFSVGFPPRAFGKQIGETDYCVSWIPIGGYVKIAGMIDESSDTDFVNRDPQPWEFRAKPIWQRMIVLSGGVVMNLLLAIVIFWGIIYTSGKTVWPTTTIGFVTEKSAAEKAGLKRGDRILSINDAEVRYWDEIENSIYVDEMGRDLTIRIEREGAIVSLSIPRSEIPSVSEERFGILPHGVVPLVVSVDEAKPAAAAGIQVGDVITRINGEPVDFYTLPRTIKRYRSVVITLDWRRDSLAMSATVTPTAEGLIGIAFNPRYEGPVDRRHFSMVGALGEALVDSKDAVGAFLRNIYAIFAGTVSFSESVGGPVRIAQIATKSAQAGLTSFLTVMAWLSLTLALLNLLPFPALDGGHLMFLTYEGIFRREIPAKVKIILQQAGFALLLVFMAFVVYNDIVNF